MSKLIRQTVTFKASPHEVYEALMDSRKHARFSQGAAKISRKVGGAISAYDGYITGSNLELVPDQKIVQAWHGSDWPAGHLSKVTFRLMPVPAGTRLSFTHSNVPDKHVASIRQGWIDNYWVPMKAMLNKNILPITNY
jgi:activator of HSP90 ATPase